ncbi:methyltransferase domain-containing protein [Paenibacillus doosanensis]|uniref:class I SAM-dependent methyltransferase n=1 Tax=Paenibacillus doosanensis TaxID=1229154 RepID=UPI0021809818|nr:class I SAM-dependent methyltransferase [Paenibacillus doosanensis]MCS7459306.1 methyltransferase domain-containing protein [Paenibacillus doosanensis]
MTMNFHARSNREMYTGRQADPGWVELIGSHVKLTGARAADIGCGGGIYTAALSLLGAESVVGIDFSAAMLEGASAACAKLTNVQFQQGNALALGLPDASLDVVLERALIHHLTKEELADCCREAYRILAPGGTLIVQDRTPQDSLIEGSTEHVRGYFFEKFPKLIAKETGRRHESSAVVQALEAGGFSAVKELPLWETRRRFERFDQFAADIRKRTGRTILHELSDEELVQLTDYIRERTGCEDEQPIEDKDRWTVWIARKH